MFIELFCLAADYMRVGQAGSKTNKNIFASKTWWGTVCESFRNRKMQALRLFRTLGNMINLADYLNIRNNYKKLCRNKKREYENKQRQKLVDSRKNPSTFWKLLKNNVTNIKSNIHPHTWYNYFKDLFSLDMQNEIGDPDFNYTPAESAICLNNPFTEAEVRVAIRKLKIGKSPGSDGIAADFFKQTSPLIVPVITLLSNKIFDSGQIPKSWSQSIMCP